MRVLFTLTMLLSCTLCGLLTLYYDKGAMPVAIHSVDSKVADVNSLTTLEFAFFNDVFMLSPFHLGSYVAGFGLAIVYRKFLREEKLNKDLQG